MQSFLCFVKIHLKKEHMITIDGLRQKTRHNGVFLFVFYIIFRMAAPRKWIRVRVFYPEYCSLPVLYYHQMNVETKVKKVFLEKKGILDAPLLKHGHLIL